MATTYAHVGDTLIVDGVNYTLERVQDDGNFSESGEVHPHIHYALRVQRIMCETCGDIEVDRGGDMCAACTMTGLRMRMLQYIMRNDDLWAAIDAQLTHEDARMSKAGIAYIDSESAARDAYEIQSDNVRDEFVREIAVDIDAAFRRNVT